METAAEFSTYMHNRAAVASVHVTGEYHEVAHFITAQDKRISDLEQRIADAEKRALTEVEINHLDSIVDGLTDCSLAGSSMGARWLREIMARLRPQPIAWHDCGDGSIAEFGGWTLTVRPCSIGNGRQWTVSRPCDGGGGRCDTIDAAKSAAEAWVRKDVG